MEPFHKDVNEYKKQLMKGAVKRAYRGLMEYIMSLRTHLSNKYPEYFVSGSIYQGYMDMSYFSFTPDILKDRKLKIAIVFIHNEIRFEVWLAGVNKQIQKKYWQVFRESGWNKYHVVPTIQGVESIVEHTLADNPDFSDLDALTNQIEKGSLQFIKNIEDFLTD